MRPGSILQPKWPAPLGMRGVTMMRNMATCLGLLNVATGGQAMAAHSAYVIWYLRGRDDKGELFLMSDGLGVGYGARPTADGNDAVYLVAQENFPSEFLDFGLPRARHSATPSIPTPAGPGRWRGGCGLDPRAGGAGAGGHGLHAHRQRRASALGRRRRACGRYGPLRRQSGPARTSASCGP